MPALTPAERQQRRRDKLAAERPPRADDIPSPIETRMTRQEAWDEACDRLDTILETYRAWKLVTPTAAEDLSTAALPGLASQVLSLTLTTLAIDWGREWYFPPGQDPAAGRPPMPARSLRELALGAPRLNEENEPRSSPEQDARARAWWAEMNPGQRGNWQRMANCIEPEDVYHVLREMIDATCRLPQRFP
jgi:hypothetical protein